MLLLPNCLCSLQATPPYAAMSTDDVVPASAAALAAVACSHPGELTFLELCQDLRGPQSLLQVLRFCWALRRNRRTRRPWTDVLRAVRQPSPPPFCRALLQHTFALYNVIRSRAAPYLPRAAGRAAFRGYVPRALARVLKRHGVLAFREEDRVSMRNRAADAIADRWDTLPGQRVVLWYDNFYRARYLANPARGYSSLNSSVLAMLPLPTLPATAPDVLTYADALRGAEGRAREATGVAQVLQDAVRIFRDGMHMPGEIRVPLDVQRPSVTSLPWQPFQVSECCVSSQVGLLRFMRFSARLAARSQCGVAPVLVDENIHYRLHKLAWSEPFLRWDVPQFLQVVPPLFGVWHAYKYCVIQVARKLHSSLWYTIRGTMADGTHVPTNPPLRSYELAFAGLLHVPLSLRQRLTQMRQQWSELHQQDQLDQQVVGTHTGVPEEIIRVHSRRSPCPRPCSCREYRACNTQRRHHIRHFHSFYLAHPQARVMNKRDARTRASCMHTAMHAVRMQP